MSEETKLCRACNKEKPLKQFYKNKYLSTGYDARCKMCKKQGKKIYKGEIGNRKTKTAKLSLFNTTDKDWIDTFNFLKRIGYDLSGEKTIHEQFCEKYNLTPKKKTYERSQRFLPSDFNLF